MATEIEENRFNNTTEPEWKRTVPLTPYKADNTTFFGRAEEWWDSVKRGTFGYGTHDDQETLADLENLEKLGLTQIKRDASGNPVMENGSYLYTPIKEPGTDESGNPNFNTTTTASYIYENAEDKNSEEAREDLEEGLEQAQSAYDRFKVGQKSNLLYNINRLPDTEENSATKTLAGGLFFGNMSERISNSVSEWKEDLDREDRVADEVQRQESIISKDGTFSKEWEEHYNQILQNRKDGNDKTFNEAFTDEYLYNTALQVSPEFQAFLNNEAFMDGLEADGGELYGEIRNQLAEAFYKQSKLEAYHKAAKSGKYTEFKAIPEEVLEKLKNSYRPVEVIKKFMTDRVHDQMGWEMQVATGINAIVPTVVSEVGGGAATVCDTIDYIFSNSGGHSSWAESLANNAYVQYFGNVRKTGSFISDDPRLQSWYDKAGQYVMQSATNAIRGTTTTAAAPGKALWALGDLAFGDSDRSFNPYYMYSNRWWASQEEIKKNGGIKMDYLPTTYDVQQAGGMRSIFNDQLVGTLIEQSGSLVASVLTTKGVGTMAQLGTKATLKCVNGVVKGSNKALTKLATVAGAKNTAFQRGLISARQLLSEEAITAGEMVAAKVGTRAGAAVASASEASMNAVETYDSIIQYGENKISEIARAKAIELLEAQLAIHGNENIDKQTQQQFIDNVVKQILAENNDNPEYAEIREDIRDIREDIRLRAGSAGANAFGTTFAINTGIIEYLGAITRTAKQRDFLKRKNRTEIDIDPTVEGNIRTRLRNAHGKQQPKIWWKATAANSFKEFQEEYSPSVIISSFESNAEYGIDAFSYDRISGLDLYEAGQSFTGGISRGIKAGLSASISGEAIAEGLLGALASNASVNAGFIPTYIKDVYTTTKNTKKLRDAYKKLSTDSKNEKSSSGEKDALEELAQKSGKKILKEAIVNNWHWLNTDEHNGVFNINAKQDYERYIKEKEQIQEEQSPDSYAKMLEQQARSLFGDTDNSKRFVHFLYQQKLNAMKDFASIQGDKTMYEDAVFLSKFEALWTLAQLSPKSKENRLMRKQLELAANHVEYDAASEQFVAKKSKVFQRTNPALEGVLKQLNETFSREVGDASNSNSNIDRANEAAGILQDYTEMYEMLQDIDKAQSKVDTKYSSTTSEFAKRTEVRNRIYQKAVKNRLKKNFKDALRNTDKVEIPDRVWEYRPDWVANIIEKNIGTSGEHKTESADGSFTLKLFATDEDIKKVIAKNDMDEEQQQKAFDALSDFDKQYIKKVIEDFDHKGITGNSSNRNIGESEARAMARDLRSLKALQNPSRVGTLNFKKGIEQLTRVQNEASRLGFLAFNIHDQVNIDTAYLLHTGKVNPIDIDEYGNESGEASIDWQQAYHRIVKHYGLPDASIESNKPNPKNKAATKAWELSKNIYNRYKQANSIFTVSEGLTKFKYDAYNAEETHKYKVNTESLSYFTNPGFSFFGEFRRLLFEYSDYIKKANSQADSNTAQINYLEKFEEAMRMGNDGNSTINQNLDAFLESFNAFLSIKSEQADNDLTKVTIDFFRESFPAKTKVKANTIPVTDKDTNNKQETPKEYEVSENKTDEEKTVETEEEQKEESVVEREEEKITENENVSTENNVQGEEAAVTTEGNNQESDQNGEVSEDNENKNSESSSDLTKLVPEDIAELTRGKSAVLLPLEICKAADDEGNVDDALNRMANAIASNFRNFNSSDLLDINDLVIIEEEESKRLVLVNTNIEGFPTAVRYKSVDGQTEGVLIGILPNEESSAAYKTTQLKPGRLYGQASRASQILTTPNLSEDNESETFMDNPPKGAKFDVTKNQSNDQDQLVLKKQTGVGENLIVFKKQLSDIKLRDAKNVESWLIENREAIESGEIDVSVLHELPLFKAILADINAAKVGTSVIPNNYILGLGQSYTAKVEKTENGQEEIVFKANNVTIKKEDLFKEIITSLAQKLSMKDNAIRIAYPSNEELSKLLNGKVGGETTAAQKLQRYEGLFYTKYSPNQEAEHRSVKITLFENVVSNDNIAGMPTEAITTESEILNANEETVTSEQVEQDRKKLEEYQVPFNTTNNGERSKVHFGEMGIDNDSFDTNKNKDTEFAKIFEKNKEMGTCTVFRHKDGKWVKIKITSRARGKSYSFIVGRTPVELKEDSDSEILSKLKDVTKVYYEIGDKAKSEPCAGNNCRG